MNSEQLSALSYDLFMMVSNLNHSIFDPHELLKSIPIPPSHMKVIFYLYHNGPTTMTDLAQNMMISKPNLTPIVNKLIEQQYAERLHNPKDRRIILVTLTDAAVQLFNAHREQMRQQLINRISVLSDEDLMTLHQNIHGILPILRQLTPAHARCRYPRQQTE